MANARTSTSFAAGGCSADAARHCASAFARNADLLGRVMLDREDVRILVH